MENWPVLSLTSFEPDPEAYFHSNTFSDHIEKHHLHVLSPHKHAFFVCVCFTKGSGWHEIDFRRYSIEPGSFFVLSPGQTHNWRFTPDTEGYVILHSAEFMMQHLPAATLQQLPFLRRNDPVNHLPLSAEQSERLTLSFSRILDDYRKGQLFWQQTCSAHLSLIYHEAARFLPAQEINQNIPESYQRGWLQFLNLLEQHHRTEHLADNYAVKMNISSRHLNRITIAASGMSAGKVITSKLILEAQRLLADNKESLTEISESLGFNEYSYFSRWFKKQTGIAPERFRKRYQGVSG